jgi:hypothetical protein
MCWSKVYKHVLVKGVQACVGEGVPLSLLDLSTSIT